MLLSQGGQKEAAECGEDPPAWMRRDREGEKKVFLAFFLRILKFFSSVNLHQTDEDFAQRGKRKGLPTFKHKSVILSNFHLIVSQVH